MQFTICQKQRLSELTDFSNSTFKRLRRKGIWIEGIHYERVNSRTIIYVPELCLHYFQNLDNPAAHQRLIDEYLQWKDRYSGLRLA